MRRYRWVIGLFLVLWAQPLMAQGFPDIVIPTTPEEQQHDQAFGAHAAELFPDFATARNDPRVVIIVRKVTNLAAAQQSLPDGHAWPLYQGGDSWTYTAIELVHGEQKVVFRMCFTAAAYQTPNRHLMAMLREAAHVQHYYQTIPSTEPVDSFAVHRGHWEEMKITREEVTAIRRFLRKWNRELPLAEEDVQRKGTKEEVAILAHEKLEWQWIELHLGEEERRVWGWMWQMPVVQPLIRLLVFAAFAIPILVKIFRRARQRQRNQQS